MVVRISIKKKKITPKNVRKKKASISSKIETLRTYLVVLRTNRCADQVEGPRLASCIENSCIVGEGSVFKQRKTRKFLNNLEQYANI